MTSISNYINAAYPLIAINTAEPDRAQQSILKELEGGSHKCYSWNITGGLTDIESGEGISIDPGPMSPLDWLMRQAPENSVLFAWNFSRFFASVEIMQAIQNSRDVLKSYGKCLVILSPSVVLPVEIEKSVQVTDFTLPDKYALSVILQSICTDAGVQYPDDAPTLIQHALGLVAFQAENAFALALSSTGLQGFNRQVITDQKAQIVKANASLEIGHYKESFSDIGGMDVLKAFTKTTIASKLSRGVLLLGTPGVGKSLLAKALGNEVGLPVLSLDFGRLFGSLVGSSEQKTRDALAVIDACAPAVVFCDEIDKGLSGAGASGNTDSGTTNRVFGTFLTWLSDHTSQIFVIATANDISNLPVELLRAERWDALFYCDLPTESERDVILSMYKKKFDIEDDSPIDTTGFSGAELKSLCRIAKMLQVSLQESLKFVIPLSKSMSKKIEADREWADGRCIKASSSTPEKKKSSKKTRSISPTKQGGNFISSN
jgi:hypothetical protein